MISNIGDTINFLSKLNGRKVRNMARVYRSFKNSVRKGKNHHIGSPIALSIEPTTSCNLRCPECISGLRAFTRNTGMMEYSLFQKLVDELAPDLSYLTLYFQGEPYLNKDFFKMVSYANQHSIYTSTSTNAHYLSVDNAERTVNSGLDRIIVSLDGLTQKTYEKYRIGGVLEKVEEGIINLSNARKKLKRRTPFIVLQFIAFKHNQEEISQVKKWGKSRGVDYVAIKTAQVNDLENNHHLIPENEELARYTKDTQGKWGIKNNFLNQCWRMWHSAVVTWDGKVVPCCFDKDADNTLGIIGESSTFSSIWESNDYARFRQQLLNSRSSIEMCKNCTEGTPTWA